MCVQAVRSITDLLRVSLMRLGIDIRELEIGKMTGIGTYLRDFIQTISLLRSDVYFFLYGNQFTDTRLAQENVCIRIAREEKTIWWDQVILPRLAGEDQVEVFLSPYIKGPKYIHCPMAITIHDLMFLAFPRYNTWRQQPKNKLFVQMARWIGNRADLILTDSDYSAKDINRFLGIEQTKIQVVPLGVDRFYSPVVDAETLVAVGQRYGINKEYILYLGNFKPHKNVKTLLQAYAGLEEGLRQRYGLVLGGRPDDWIEELKVKAQILGIADQVFFIGSVASEDMPALYSGAKLFVFPSLYEGFGLPPLEAMACGTAVVVANRTSLPEVVGDAGILVEGEDSAAYRVAISAVLGNDNRRDDLVKRGIARAAEFKADKIYIRQLQLLEKLCQINT